MTDLYNPFTGEVSKAVSPMYGAKDAFANQPTRKVASLLPTGKHVSHANDLHVTRHGRRKSVGRYGDTKLQHFGKRERNTGRGAATGASIGTGAYLASALGSRKAIGGYLKGGGSKGKMAASMARGAAIDVGTGAAIGAVIGSKKVKKNFSDLASQPGMVNPGVVTSSWSHGTPNQNFAAQSGRRGRKIA